MPAGYLAEDGKLIAPSVPGDEGIEKYRQELRERYESACLLATTAAQEAERQRAIARATWAALRELDRVGVVEEYAPHRWDEPEVAPEGPPQTNLRP